MNQMNFDRISTSIGVQRLQQTCIACVGSAVQLLGDLARCGVGAFNVCDLDRVDQTNPARQDFFRSQVGHRKADVQAAFLRQINPQVQVRPFSQDITSMNPSDVDEFVAGVDLLVAATDSFVAQARCSQIAVERGIPLLAPGIYPRGEGGEIIYSLPGMPCFRCIARSRYEAFEQGATDSSSQGGTIVDLRVVDGIAGQIALGMLTRGEDNRFGRLVEQLDGRNLLLVKLSPDLSIGEPDLFTARLGDDPANFAFTTIALRVAADPNCPDCRLAHKDLVA